MFTNEPVNSDGAEPRSRHRSSQSWQPKYRVRVCHNTTCTKDGALAVFHALQARDLPDVEIVSSGCLGCCGNGPMVLVLPDETWYSHVQPTDVPVIATQHLTQGQPVIPLRDRHKHPQSQTPQLWRSRLWAYGILVLALVGAIASIGWTIWTWG